MDAAIKWLTVATADILAGDEAIHESHSPGDIGRYPIIAIARDQASDAANRIAKRRSRCAQVEHGKRVQFVVAGQEKQRSDDGEESTEPGKAAAEPLKKLLWSVNIRQRVDELPGRLELVIKLRPEHPGESRPQYDVVGNVGKMTPARF